MKKTKVCIIADSIDTQYAGIFTYASQLIPALERLAPEDMEITYLHQEPNAFFEGRRELLIPSHRRYPGADTVRRMYRIPAVLRSEGFDIVHDLGHIAPFPKRQEHYKKVLTIHDLTPLIMPELHVRRSRLMHRFVFPKIVENADHILTVSETTKRDVVRLLRPRAPVTVTSLASKPLEYTGERLTDMPYILCVSTLEPRKNIDLLVRSFERLKETGVPHVLVLVGKEGWHVQGLMDYIAKSRWSDAIVCTGYVSDEALGTWYAHAELVVYPSQYEGCGLPMLEAMHAGRAVLANDTPAAREIAGNSAEIFSMTEESLYTTLRQYVQHPKQARVLGERGKGHVDGLSWDMTAQKTLEVYRGCLS